ncbi:MAG TPA: sulfatase, partial [Verrucomicrobiales bacterium]|nr:sulfatase [Verrucomicrobiales bacterium]
RMQTSVPELTDLGGEDSRTLALYGIADERQSFARNCLLARRLIERDVRVVELYDADWDHHSNLAERLPAKCREVDQPLAALITDLKQRGLLEDTLVIWGSEFGRTPMQQVDSGAGNMTKPGRDHHKEAFTVWLAGGGVKRGFSFGATDEFGYAVVDRPVHVHDLNATVLHLLGIDHERLTFRFQGREYRLTDVHGHVIREILM